MQRDKIFKTTLQFAKKYKRVPTTAELVIKGINRNSIRYYFGSYTILVKMVKSQVKLKNKVDSLVQLMRKVAFNEA